MKIDAKRFTRIVAVIALTALVSTFGAQFAEAASPVRYISVSSIGTVKAEPDAVRLSASVSAIAKINKDALSEAGASATKFRQALAENGIDKKDLRSTTLNIYPE